VSSVVVRGFSKSAPRVGTSRALHTAAGLGCNDSLRPYIAVGKRRSRRSASAQLREELARVEEHVLE